MMARLAPYAILLAQVIVFHRVVLFDPAFLIPYDLPGYHEPLATYAARSLGGLRFPLWDNTTYCGFPFYANVQTQLFYPAAWPFFALLRPTGVDDMRNLLEWQVVLHIWLGGALLYRLLRHLECGVPAAVLGATVFQLGGFSATQAQHLGIVCAASWLPLLWLAALQGRAVLLAFGAAMTWLAGYPSAAVVNLTLTALISWRTVLRAAPLSVGLICCQLLPALELSSLSDAPNRHLYKGGAGGIPWEAFISLVWPNYHRIFSLAEYKLPYNPTFLYLYCGLLPLALCIRARWQLRLWILLAVTTVWMMGDHTPIGRAVYAALPGPLQSLIIPELALAPFIAIIAILAARGCTALEPRLLWAAIIVVAADLTYAGSNRYWNTGRLADWPPVTATQFEGSPVTLTNLRRAIQQAEPPWRLDVINDSMAWASAATVTGIPTATGNDPLVPGRLKDVRVSFAKGDSWKHYYTVDRPLSPVLDLLNVRYLLVWEKTPEAPALPIAPYGLPGHQLHENADALPRFFLVGETRRASSRAEAVAMLRDPGFAPSRFAIVEDTAAMKGTAQGQVKVLRYLSRRVELEVAAAGPSFLVSSETWYPGWRASIDGSPVSIVLTNAAFRGIAVPAGTHRVEMVFSPTVLWYTLPISAAAWLWLAVRLWRRQV